MYNKEYLTNQILKGIECLKSFEDEEFIRHFQINDIDLSKFTVPKINKEGNFEGKPTAYREEYIEYVQKKLNDNLNDVSNPCLYVFEIVSPEDVNTTFEAFKKFSNNQKILTGLERRSCSTMHQILSNNIDSGNRKILYVGKSQKPIDGRIVVHFGYYEKGIPGLQLVYWAKDIGLKVNVHIFELVNKDFQPYLETLEKLLFVQLKPIIGKR